MEEQKIGFFKRVKMAIFNFEEYLKFAEERQTKTFAYIFKLITIVAIIITIATTYVTFKMIENTEYNNLPISNFDKQYIEAFFSENNPVEVYLILGVILLITSFIVFTISIFINILILSVLGLIVNAMAKTNLNYKKIFNMSVYAITLSTILLVIYMLIISLTDFTIKYFDIAYDVISYIYIITAILMIKSDGIKNKQELYIKNTNLKEEYKKELEKPESKGEEEKEQEKGKEKKEKKEKTKNQGEPEANEA